MGRRPTRIVIESRRHVSSNSDPDHAKLSTTRSISAPSSSSSSSPPNSDGSTSSSSDEVIYRAPMGDLISRLKLVSITGCALSIIVLPTLVYLKNGDLPSAKQTALGGVALVGASGSTLALDFVFGPYILDLRWINDQNRKDGNYVETGSRDQDDGITGEKDDPDTPPPSYTSSRSLQATTRSVFGWKKTYTFDPYIDITPYAGVRPFANFYANGIPFYAHPELLDDTMKQLLLNPRSVQNGNGSADATTDDTKKETGQKNQKQQQQQRVEGIRDDDLF